MYSNQPDFYMAATDVYRLERPLHCWQIKILRRDEGNSQRTGSVNATVRDEYLLIKVDPPFVIRGRHVDEVLVAAKDPNVSWSSVGTWPVFVFVLNVHVKDVARRHTIRDDEFMVLEWAALFKTEEDASEYL